MKLPFEENLSFKLAEKLADVYPESVHVRSLGLTGARDHEIWDFASAEGFTIVSKDDDFRQLSILHGAPPKVIWLQVGNYSTSEIEQILRRRYPAIEAFDRAAEASFLIVPKDAV